MYHAYYDSHALADEPGSLASSPSIEQSSILRPPSPRFDPSLSSPRPCPTPFRVFQALFHLDVFLSLLTSSPVLFSHLLLTDAALRCFPLLCLRATCFTRALPHGLDISAFDAASALAALLCGVAACALYDFTAAAQRFTPVSLWAHVLGLCCTLLDACLRLLVLTAAFRQDYIRALCLAEGALVVLLAWRAPNGAPPPGLCDVATALVQFIAKPDPVAAFCCYGGVLSRGGEGLASAWLRPGPFYSIRIAESALLLPFILPALGFSGVAHSAVYGAPALLGLTVVGVDAFLAISRGGPPQEGPAPALAPAPALHGRGRKRKSWQRVPQLEAKDSDSDAADAHGRAVIRGRVRDWVVSQGRDHRPLERPLAPWEGTASSASAAFAASPGARGRTVTFHPALTPTPDKPSKSDAAGDSQPQVSWMVRGHSPRAVPRLAQHSPTHDCGLGLLDAVPTVESRADEGGSPPTPSSSGLVTPGGAPSVGAALGPPPSFASVALGPDVPRTATEGGVAAAEPDSPVWNATPLLRPEQEAGGIVVAPGPGDTAQGGRQQPLAAGGVGFSDAEESGDSDLDERLSISEADSP